MSVEATDGEFVSLASRLRDALLASGRLAPQDGLRIEEAMRTLGLGFGEAAIQIQGITKTLFCDGEFARLHQPVSFVK